MGLCCFGLLWVYSTSLQINIASDENS
jgi:hypothetical protein